MTMVSTFVPPETERLAERLWRALDGIGSPTQLDAIVDRQANACSSSFPSEILSCAFTDGSTRKILCKYGVGHSTSGHGHRGGVSYEAACYREILGPSQAAVPRFYGSVSDEATGETWLFTEFLEGSLRLRHAPSSDAMDKAAAWIGRFHATMERRIEHRRPGHLLRYDEAYFSGWSDRSRRSQSVVGEVPPWMGDMCTYFENRLDVLEAASKTVIHGEYYPSNVLYHENEIKPIDWESTAIGPGEIDLAMLADRWPQQDIDRFAEIYERERWGGHAPGTFRSVLDLARLYTHFRWIGDAKNAGKSSWRFDEIHAIGRRYGIIANEEQ